MEAVAAGDDAAAQLVLLTVGDVADDGVVAVDLVDRHVRRLEHDRVAGGEAGGDEILDDLLLAVHGDRVADQLVEVEAVAATLEGQLDAAVGEPLAVEPIGEAEVAEQGDTRVFEHAGADAMLDVVAVVTFEDDAVDAAGREEVGEDEPGRSGPDDRDRGRSWRWAAGGRHQRGLQFAQDRQLVGGRRGERARRRRRRRDPSPSRRGRRRRWPPAAAPSASARTSTGRGAARRSR